MCGIILYDILLAHTIIDVLTEINDSAFNMLYGYPSSIETEKECLLHVFCFVITVINVFLQSFCIFECI